MLPEFAQALAASKRARKLMIEADNVIREAETCSTSLGVDKSHRDRNAMAVGDGAAAMKAASAAAAVASDAMQKAFDEWKLVR